LERSGLSQQRLAEAISMHPTALSKALSERRRFSSAEVARIAGVLATSVDELIGSAEIDGVRIAARAQPQVSSALRDATSRVRQFLDVDALLTENGFDAATTPFPLVTPVGRAAKQGEALAVRTREWAGIGDDDIEELAGFCEKDLLIDVAVEPLPQGLDGLSVCQGDYRLALISSSIPATRQRYTLAHEIGHIVAGDGDGMVIDENVFGIRTDAETRANAFAAAFLMPVGSLRRMLAEERSEERAIARMLLSFKVSLDALAFRLHNVGLVDAAGRDRIRALSGRRPALVSRASTEYYRQLQDHAHRRLPALLLTRALDAYGSGAVRVRDLSVLTGISEMALLAQLGPRQRSTARRGELTL
jgi:Zn-dependent peptidase ImmA (M78 family)/transcriptional regulator with XRE-family HTH domain